MPASTTAEMPCDLVRAGLEHVSRKLVIAHGLVGAGRPVDLAGLDAEMGLICARVLALPAAEGCLLRPALIALRGQLSVLCQALAASDATPA